MSKLPRGSHRGVGAAVIFALIVLAAILLGLILKLASRQGPTVTLQSPVKGLGVKTELTVQAIDRKHNLKSLSVEVIQNGQVLHQSSLLISSRPSHWWSSRQPSTATWKVLVGRQVSPALKEGRATLRVTALNDSWGRFFRGGRGELVLDLPVRFTAPQVGVLTSQHYINQGGCDMVVYIV